MTPDIISNSSFDSFLLPRVGAIVTNKPTRSVTPVLKNPLSSSKIALWGDANDFPQKVIQDVRKDPEIGTLLNKQAALLYSAGLTWGKATIGENGEEKFVALSPERHREIRDWMYRSNIKRYLIEGATDFYWFRNMFPEVVLSRDRSKILQLCIQSAEISRWEVMNANGIVENCYINANFPEAKETDKETKTLPVIDPYYDAAGNLKAGNKTNYIYPLSYPSPGSTYYQVADWDSIRQSGWLTISQLIPEFKKAILEKQLTIKYHVEISDQYWQLKYKGFDTLEESAKQQIKQAELKSFSDIMSGVENAGNSLFTPMITKAELAKEFSMWKITAIDDKIKDGKFLEDGKDASLYKSQAVGLHPALIGNVANSGLGGAGSNIREAYNLHMLMVKAHQDIILEPLYLVRDYNGWDPDVEFRFKNSFMNTLDKGSETTKTIS